MRWQRLHRPPLFLPTLKAVHQVTRIDTQGAQGGCQTLANLVALGTVDDDRGFGCDAVFPVQPGGRVVPSRSRDLHTLLLAQAGAANVQQLELKAL